MQFSGCISNTIRFNFSYTPLQKLARSWPLSSWISTNNQFSIFSALRIKFYKTLNNITGNPGRQQTALEAEIGLKFKVSWSSYPNSDVENHTAPSCELPLKTLLKGLMKLAARTESMTRKMSKDFEDWIHNAYSKWKHLFKTVKKILK